MTDVADAAREFVQEWVSRYRAHEGQSLREAEAGSGIPFTTIARIERGEGNVTLSTLMQIARWTSDADDLFSTLATIAQSGPASGRGQTSQDPPPALTLQGGAGGGPTTLNERLESSDQGRSPATATRRSTPKAVTSGSRTTVRWRRTRGQL